MDKQAGSSDQRAWSKDEEEQSMEQRALIGRPRRRSPLIRSEKGLALVTVLVLSLICLSVISTLLYMVIQGTRFSGFYKRYETAREAALGGAELGADLILDRGALSVPGLALTSTSGSFTSCDCGDPDDPNDNLDNFGAGVRTCLCDKLCDATADWPACSFTLNPTDTPDLWFDLTGINTTYRVSVKIVDTIRGNSDLSGEELGGTGVVSSTSGLITAPPMPYLYRVEINSEDTGDLEERARYSALYAF
jgi:hypothetical protein